MNDPEREQDRGDESTTAKAKEAAWSIGGVLQAIGNFLATEIRLQDRTREAAAATPVVGQASATVTVGDDTASVSVGGDGKPKEPPAEKEADDATLRGLVLKVAGAVAAAIGITGFITVVGGAIFYLRFDRADLPAIQAVTAMPEAELLVQGVQAVVIFVLIAAAAVIFIGLVDPKGVMTFGSALALAILSLVALGYVRGTSLDDGIKVLLYALVLILAAVCVRVAWHSGKKFWPLATAVFLVALFFSMSTALLRINNEDEYVQGIAILRGPTDIVGLTGIYVATSEKNIHFGSVFRERRGLYSVPRTVVTTYAIGPLESRAEAYERAKIMRDQLLKRAESEPVAPPAEAAAGKSD